MKYKRFQKLVRLVKITLICGVVLLSSGCIRNRFECKSGNLKRTPADGSVDESGDHLPTLRSPETKKSDQPDSTAPTGDKKNTPPPTSKNTTSTSSQPLWTLGYYVGSQSTQYPPKKVNFEALTHLAVGAILPNEDGSLNTNLNQAAESDGANLIDQLVSLAHEKNVKALAMLGGKGSREALLSATSPVTLRRFVAELVTYTRDVHQMDGLDLAWEPFEVEDHAQFEELIDALRFEWPDVILTFPIRPLNANYQKADSFIAKIAPKLDQINIMSYAMATAFSGSDWDSWHSSALKGERKSTPMSVSENVDLYVESGVPAAKIGLGIGFFGICYSAPVTGPGQALRGSKIIASGENLSYAKIMRDYLPYAKYSYDDVADVPYLMLDPAINGCTYISFENERSIKSKAKYAREMRLGGAIIWTINQGYLADAADGKRDPLMKTIQEQF